LRGGNFADTLIGDAGDNFLQGGQTAMPWTAAAGSTSRIISAQHPR
jgi:hypothetical protein